MLKENNCFDAIVIGSGISGIISAIALSEKNLKVAIFSKEDFLGECNTRYAQGGIVATGLDDSQEKLKFDILRAGVQANCIEAVDAISAEAPKLVEEFLVNKIKIPFSRNQDGEMDRTKEAAHSVRRIIHAKDKSGDAIETGLLSYLISKTNVEIFTHHIAIDLITNSHNSTNIQERYKKTKVLGVYVLDEKEEKIQKYFAKNIVLATGGIGNLYLHTSNYVGSTGDGIAMADRVGAEIINAEFVQFHPTVLFHRDIKRFLITEALRGEGARLLNKNGEYFMSKYSPELKELAPRDEVARAIYKEMELCGAEYVLLDATKITNIDIADRFPGIFSKCMEVGIDIRKEPIPVVPAAHYFCGGIKVNLNSETSVDGLYAVGECACTGVHGANRLASVSLLEGAYFPLKMAEKIAEKNHKQTNLPVQIIESIPEWISPVDQEDFDPVLLHQDLLVIQTTMWNYCGIVRSKKRISRALADLNYLRHRIEKFYMQAKINRKIIELRNAVIAASVIVKAASSNGVSKGCHFIK